jgi:mRNA interferase RelE/StbE
LKINITETAKREFRRLPQEIQKALKEAIEGLVENPFPSNAKGMQPPWKGHWRIKVRKVYRIIYFLDEGALELLVVRVGHRKDIYR